jgi:hypothetical protein
MFSRWSQEDFFRYMRQSYNLGGLIDYGMVVNPAHRTLDGQVRKKLGVLSRKIAEFGAMNLEGEIEPRKVEAFAQRKSDLQETITQRQTGVDGLKAQRKATPRHISFKDLPKETRFDRPSTQSKHVIDTIKMVAYRAETARYRSSIKTRRVMTMHAASCVPSTAQRSISYRICRPRPSLSVSPLSPTHPPIKPLGTSAPRSTPLRPCFPALIRA